MTVIYSSTYFLNYSLKIEDYLLVVMPWLFSVWATHKNRPKYEQKKPKYVLAPFFRSYMVIVILSILLLFIFRKELIIIKNITIALVIYSFLEYFIYFIITKSKSKKEIVKQEVKTKKYSQEKFKLLKNGTVDISKIDFKQLKLKKESLQELYSQNDTVNDGKISINSFSENNIDLLILNDRINDLKDINNYLTKAYNIINKGGYLILSYKDLDDVEEEINSKNGIIKFFSKVKYYIFDRAFPKLPFFNKIHSILSNNKNKVISKTEVWGRLIYNGFDVKKEIKEGNLTFLIAQKDRTPSENPNPSFSPLIRLNRVSLYGNLIKIYKVRSMYPYSEFLQEKVYEMNSLTSTGKFSEDFRITKLGKIYRKYWIDELPQFLDWFRGSIKLVGIRAMSQHFFSLYSKEYQELFYRVKPGIISPIFDEETDSFETIQKIEQEYLEKYLKNPLKTDIEYFFITIKHMLKGVRSK
ncbi:sugar transferase [uncultured Polaribacter sp.]|uniref:sugar transferase n=1 Tax=uncultured Polaribacter sp. TaxID=174711 RepID=UPI00259B3C75|nr:sugar transferase [uncultured Polaribacter sp.]